MTKYVSAGLSVTGKLRRHNEDAILLRDDIGLWVVADGMGGHSAGDYASALIVERLGALTRPESVLDFIEAIEDALQQVNVDLIRTAAERGVGIIGSTVVVLVHDHGVMLCGWVGDSRAYCMENGVLEQLSVDHVVDSQVDVTQISGHQAAPQPGAGVLTRAVGAEEDLVVDWVLAGHRSGMQFVLCSDGMNKEVTDAELEDECRRLESPQALVDGLLGLALNRAARDNISVVAVRLQD